MDRTIIEQYFAGSATLGQAIRNLTVEDLNAFPVPGTRSIQQIDMHMMDSDLIVSDRLKRVIAEENPTLIGYNENAFAKNLLFYDQLNAAQACEIFRVNRLMTANILRRLPDAAFARIG